MTNLRTTQNIHLDGDGPGPEVEFSTVDGTLSVFKLIFEGGYSGVTIFLHPNHYAALAESLRKTAALLGEQEGSDEA